MKRFVAILLLVAFVAVVAGCAGKRHFAPGQLKKQGAPGQLKKAR